MSCKSKSHCCYSPNEAEQGRRHDHSLCGTRRSDRLVSAVGAEVLTQPGPSMATVVVTGIVSGFVILTLVIVAFSMVVLDLSFGAAIGFGLFTGAFGGAGFGGMMGGVVAVVRGVDGHS